MKEYKGVPIGKHITRGKNKGRFMLYNHWILTIKTQAIEDTEHLRIVGFLIEPRSYKQGEKITMEWHKHESLWLDELRELGD